MQFKRYDKRYLPMLWTGLAIWLVAWLGSAILDWIGIEVSGQENLMDIGKSIFQKSPIGTILLLCVFQPIFEEVSFRLWGVGKKGATIVCLIFMAIFALSEMGLWGLLFVGAFIAVWLLVKDTFKRNWINTIITSACFALCHVSGYDGISLGMVLGLLDIFGMAIVMCWLTINLSFWFSALLHVLNNSLALAIPLLFMPAPVSTVHEFSDNAGVEIQTSVVGLKPFADNSALINDSADNVYLYMLDSTMNGFTLVGEPAELYASLLTRANKEDDVYFDWTSVGENLEERVVYHIKYDKPMISNKEQLAAFCRSDMEAYLDGTFVLDTTEFDLMSVILVYLDGEEVNLDDVDSDDWWRASNEVVRSVAGIRGNTLISEYDTNGCCVNYCILRPNALNEQMDFLSQMTERLNGFSIKYVPAKKARMVTVKIKT